MLNNLLKSPVLLLLFNLSTFPLFAQLDDYQFKGARVPVHKVFVYAKSNIDGTHSSNTALFVKDEQHMESFKWTNGNGQGTLVKAVMDWETFSIASFDTYRLSPTSEPQQMATLRTEEGPTLSIRAGDRINEQVNLTYFPWQSYDFDFAGLSMITAHRKNLESDSEFMITDFRVIDNQPNVREFGMVQMKYLRKEDRHGFKCVKYSIDGPGLDNRGGLIWFDAKSGFLVGFEIQLPDEPGYENGKLELLEVRAMNETEWKTFIAERLNP